MDNNDNNNDSNNGHTDEFEAAIQTCALLVDGLGHDIRQAIAKGVVSEEEVSDLFECLGGTFARYLLDAVQHYGKSEIPDSFLEGFCGYLRYRKTQQREDGSGDSSVNRLISAVDKNVFRN